MGNPSSRKPLGTESAEKPDFDMRREVCPSHHRTPVGRFEFDHFPLMEDWDRAQILLWLSTLNPPTATGDWKFILDTLEAYSTRNANNPHSSILSHQMYLIASLSFQGRKEVGGWAGDFVKFVFLYSAKSVADDPAFWDNPPGTEKHRIWPHGSKGDYRFSALKAGEHHFEKHLKPSFYQYIRAGFDRILKEAKPEEKMDRMIAYINEVTTEHEAFIKKAVIPAFDRVRVLGSAFGDSERWFAKKQVEPDARALRRNTIDRVTLELTSERKITGSERIQLLAVAGLNVMPPF